MKSIIFGLALIAVVACDVSHLQGQGWSKDENGYNYPKPATKFDPISEAPVEQELVVEVPEPELEIVAEEPAGCVTGSEEGCAVAEVVVEDVPIADAPVVEVTNDYLPPATQNEYLPPSNDYLPPAEELKLRKRQAQAKRQIPQVRRVYRRVYRRL